MRLCDLPERRRAKIKPQPDGCWLWVASQRPDGYGQIWIRFAPGPHGRRLESAHRAVFEELVGPIPAGLVIDHLCRVRLCVNPDHLEPVTQRENLIRGEGFAAKNAAKTHCNSGHLLAGENLVVVTDGDGNRRRKCRQCRKDRSREWREARKAA